MTQVDDHFDMRLTSLLINRISSNLQKLLMYFNCTAILTSFVLPAAGDFPVILTLNLNDSESVKVTFG